MAHWALYLRGTQWTSSPGEREGLGQAQAVSYSSHSSNEEIEAIHDRIWVVLVASKREYQSSAHLIVNHEQHKCVHYTQNW